MSTLGLVMQLAGMLFAAFMCFSIFTMIVQMNGRLSGELGWMMLVLGSCAVRSLFHRAAGTELLYGNRNPLTDTVGSPLAGLNRYIVIALAHSALMAVVLLVKFEVTMKIAVTFGVAFALWPALLATLLATGRFRHLKDGIPVAEDKGFEGASILMTIMGAIGSMLMGLMLFMMIKEGGKLLSSGYGVLIIAAIAMLFIRSVLHLQAGLSGLRETSLERSVERAARYANFGVIASFSASGAMMLLSMQGSVHLLMFVMVALVCWMLLVWPLIIRRFFSDRQFVDLLAGDGANLHRRAPDAGLTGLGWFLLGYAVLGASMTLPQVVLGDSSGMRGMNGFDTLGTLFGAGQIGGRSIWFNVGVLALQGWAGFELIRMSASHKLVATGFGIVAAAVTIYQYLPTLKALKQVDDIGRFDSVAMMCLPLAVALMIPVTAIVLVNRKIAPMATARFRR